MVKLAVNLGLKELICGVDLAGNEYDYPPELFVEAFDLAY